MKNPRPIKGYKQIMFFSKSRNVLISREGDISYWDIIIPTAIVPIDLGTKSRPYNLKELKKYSKFLR